MIDSHVHIFPPEIIRNREDYLARDRRFAALYESPQAKMVTAEDLLAHMAETGVRKSVVFGYAFSDQGLCRFVNNYVIEAAGCYPDRLAGLACVWTGGPGAAKEVERCLDAGLRGCGELVLESEWSGKRSGKGSGRAWSGLGAIAGLLKERGLPLLVHANELVGHSYPGKGPFGPEACVSLAQAFPGLTMVLAHLGGGAFLYEAMPEVAAALADVYYDTAAVPYLYRPSVYQAVLATAGAHKLVFGSDYPLLSPARYRAGLDHLPEEARSAVCEDNARRIFGL